MAHPIDRVIVLTGEFFVDDGRQSGLEHRLQGFLEVGVPAAGAHLAVAHGPVPGALEIAGNSSLPVAAGHQVLGLQQAHEHRILAVGGGEAELQAHRIFLDQAQAEAGRQFEVAQDCGHDARALIQCRRSP